MTKNELQPETRPSESVEARTGSSGPQNQWRPPAHHVRVCVSSSCDARSDELRHALERRLGISLDERTADGIALEGLDCIGLCDIRQAVLIDDEPVIGRDDVLQAMNELLR